MINTLMGAREAPNGQYTVDCAVVPGLPELSFTLNGKVYPLKGPDYILQLQGLCISPFLGMDLNIPGGDLWILGRSRPSTLSCCRLRLLMVIVVLSKAIFSCANIILYMILGETRLVLHALSNYEETTANTPLLIQYVTPSSRDCLSFDEWSK